MDRVDTQARLEQLGRRAAMGTRFSRMGLRAGILYSGTTVISSLVSGSQLETLISASLATINLSGALCGEYVTRRTDDQLADLAIQHWIQQRNADSNGEYIQEDPAETQA